MAHTDVWDRPMEGEVGGRKEVKCCRGSWGSLSFYRCLGEHGTVKTWERLEEVCWRAPISSCCSKLSVCVLSGIWDRLLISPKPNCRKKSTLQTVRIERSPCKYFSLSSLPSSLKNFLWYSVVPNEAIEIRSEPQSGRSCSLLPLGSLRGVSVLGAADSVFIHGVPSESFLDLSFLSLLWSPLWGACILGPHCILPAVLSYHERPSLDLYHLFLFFFCTLDGSVMYCVAVSDLTSLENSLRAQLSAGPLLRSKEIRPTLFIDSPV